MRDARHAIFARLKEVRGTRPRDAAQIWAEAEALIADPTSYQRAVEGDLAGRFMDETVRDLRGASGERLESMDDVPGAVAARLGAWNATAAVKIGPRLQHLRWPGLTLVDTLEEDGGAAVSLADYAVAETGSLIMLTAADQPLLDNFLPEFHILVAERRNLVAHMEEVWAKIGDLPRASAIITGSSSSADIQGTSIRGAHGPRLLHVILVG